jgi:hypothetical protein
MNSYNILLLNIFSTATNIWWSVVVDITMGYGNLLFPIQIPLFSHSTSWPISWTNPVHHLGG